MRHVLPLLVLLLAPLAARGQPLAAIHPVWVPSEGVEPPEAIPALLIAPAGWSVGDAAVILVASEAPSSTHPAMTDVLLAEDAAVLVLAVRGQPAAPWVGGAVRLLVVQQGAGLVVAIGQASAAEALDATAKRARTAPPAHHLRTLAAAVILSSGGTRFIPGAAQEPEQGWPQRASLLCAALASAVPPGDSSCASALLAQPRPSLAGVP